MSYLKEKPVAVKLIAVDMDGTFLDSAKRYNKARFLRQYAQLKERDIRFVVASGNQYYQLESYFPEIAGEIAFVAENGAWISDRNEEVFCGELSADNVRRVMAILAQEPEIHTVVCGKRSAYISPAMPDETVALLSNHYRRLEKCADLDHIDDTIFKFSLNLPHDGVEPLIARLTEALNAAGNVVRPVSSGFGFVDLIIPGLHKAHGISLLQQRWGIDDCEVVAIGDSGNDIEMLRQAGYSFAMANATEAVSAAARYRTEDHNEEGALNVISRVLAREYPFN
ncbi:HAD family hydrolase [Pantoea sp. PSNIH4]|nr:sugar phosphatase [Pantoea sp. PSNIH2]POU49522.1 HAD family hydrolase [Pantoea sp. PSNIH5]POU65534.1 HAD family hydrolase [Pantoea sp. PSNIH4]POY67407.1 HAD family hydrolase [Pantoea sp. PSNIH3]